MIERNYSLTDFQFRISDSRATGRSILFGSAGKSGTSTTLTWLMNIDFGGLIPVSAVQSKIMTSMFYPKQKLLELEERTGGKAGPIDVGMAAKTQIKAMEEKMAAMQADFDAETARLRRENEEMRAKLKGGTPSVDSVPRSLG